MPDTPFLVDRSGAPDLTYGQTLSGRFILTSRGVRLPQGAAASERARAMAAHLPLRPESVLSHTTAASIHGLPLPAATSSGLPVHATTPRGVPRPRRRDIVTHHAQLPDADVCVIDGLRLTTPPRTYIDLASLLGFDDLVAVGDAVLRRAGLDSAELLALVRRRASYPGRRLAVLAIPWLDPRAESPRESHLRVLLRRAGLPHPEVNGLIADEDGQFLARGDLVFRKVRVIVEYDGEVHAAMAQRAKDAARRALLREHGWIVVEVVGDDMRFPERVLRRVRSALADGAARAAHA